MSVIASLVSYWSLDEASGNALDAHGSNPLADQNTVAATTGKVAGARDFEDGNSEYFSHASNADLQTGDIGFTWACWLNIESIGAAAVLFGKWDGGTTNKEYMLRKGVSDGLSFFVSNDGSAQNSADHGTALSAATWYFVVCWHDPTANTINVQLNNGTPASTPHTTGVFVGAAEFQMGRRVDGPEYYDGLIDEVGFWKKVLTDAEKTWLYNGGAGRSYAAIVAESVPFTVAGRTALDYGPD